jgi:NADH-quinone oxidoreductase subunit E
MKKVLEEFHPDQRELIHILHRIQKEYNYIPPEIISEVSRKLKISESEIFGVLTFYNAFTLEPRGKHLVTVCMGTACHVRGAPAILDELRRSLDIEPGETSEDKMFTLETVNCVGACALGPIIIIDGEYHGQMKTQKVEKLLRDINQNEE